MAEVQDVAELLDEAERAFFRIRGEVLEFDGIGAREVVFGAIECLLHPCEALGFVGKYLDDLVPDRDGGHEMRAPFGEVVQKEVGVPERQVGGRVLRALCLEMAQPRHGAHEFAIDANAWIRAQRMDRGEDLVLLGRVAQCLVLAD